MNKAFQRKLTALQHPQAAKFDATGGLAFLNYTLCPHFCINEGPNPMQFKHLILWIEDQQIRQYKIDERAALRNLQEPDWTKGFETYLKDVSCPFPSNDRMSVLDWLLGLAVRLEFGDNVEKYGKVTGAAVEAKRKQASAPTSTISIQNICADDQSFRNGINSIAKILQVPLHEDYLVTLKAIKILVEERLTPDAIEKAKNKKVERGVSRIPVADNELGFDTKDPIVNEAAKALRLLHIQELRQLQNKINEAIVSVQTITANPKTDQRLGKVGR